MALLLVVKPVGGAEVGTTQASQVFAEVNAQLPRMAPVSFRARRPDVAYVSEVRAWSDAGGVRKLEVTDRDDSGDVISEYYFAGRQLVFVYGAIRGYTEDNRQVTRNEDRQYFGDGQMIRWLGGRDKVEQPRGSPDYLAAQHGRLAAAAFYQQAAERAAASQASPTSNTGAEVKATEAILIGHQQGDAACYLTLRSDAGKPFTERADFETCATADRLTGKRVRLAYTTGRVMHEDCQGNPACGKSRTVALISSMRPVEPAAVGAALQATPVGAASFCTALETTVFTCRAGAKRISVCADPASTAQRGYVQYRFGKADGSDRLEMELPTGRVAPPTAAAGGSVVFAAGGSAWLRFVNGDHAYVVYTGIGKWGPQGAVREKEGLVVERRGKQIASLKCSQAAVSRLGPEWFDQVGITARNGDFDLPD